MANVLGIITARGGSKELPGKNIRMLAGKPLIAYTIEAALGLNEALCRLIVSTDDDQIAAVSRSCGAEVPFMRPSELSQDDTPSLPVVQHAVRFVEEQEGRTMDWVFVLQPPSPLRKTSDLADALDLALDQQPSAVISVCEAPNSHPLKLKKIEEGMIEPYDPNWREGLRRQDFTPKVYKTNGAIYLVRRDVLMECNSLWGERVLPVVMPPERSIDIDSLMDFQMAELMMLGCDDIPTQAHTGHHR